MALVFQYGSNMSTSRLNHESRLKGDATVIGVAKTVDNFELSFTVWSELNQCAAADLTPSRTGRNIYGVLYDIPNFLLTRESSKVNKRKSLDAIEGEGNNYIRKTIDVIKSNGTKVSAITYVVKSPEGGIKTSWAYVEHIFAGCKEHQLPTDYYQYVVSRILENNPELGSQIALT